MSKIKFLPLMLVSIVISCGENSNQQPPIGSNTISTTSINGVTYPVKTGYFPNAPFTDKNLSYVDMNGTAVFEGDIILDTHPNKSLVNSSVNTRWPDSTVYYEIDPALSEATKNTAIPDAIVDFTDNTNLSFVQSNTAPNRILFTRVYSSDFAGRSSVGYQGGIQLVELSEGYGGGTVRAIIHETGHAVGLWHEQSRSDREQFVHYNSSNVDTSKNNLTTANQQYNIAGSDGVNVGSYDFGSIMHYRFNAFALQGTSTLILQPGVVVPDLTGGVYGSEPTKLEREQAVGQVNVLSAGDIAGVNFMYPQRSKAAIAQIEAAKMILPAITYLSLD